LTVISKDTSGVSVSTTTDVETRTWIEKKFMIALPEESIRVIVKWDEMVFRFYFGPVPVTYILKGKKLGLLKEAIG